MNDPHQEFDFFIRRWQVRLFIAGFVVPPVLFVVLGVIWRRETDGSLIGCAILAMAFFLPALLLQGWRSVAHEKAAKERRKLRRAAEAQALAETGQ